MQYKMFDDMVEDKPLDAHYKKLVIQPRQYARANGLDYDQANVVKYITRFRDKNGLQDLQKAINVVKLLAKDEYGVDL